MQNRGNLVRGVILLKQVHASLRGDMTCNDCFRLVKGTQKCTKGLTVRRDIIGCSFFSMRESEYRELEWMKLR